MSSPKHKIPYYETINDFLTTIPFPNRTTNPDFYCLRVQDSDAVKKFYKPPFRRSFYVIALLNNAGNSQITFDNMSEVDLNTYLVFQSPGLISSLHRTEPAYGYIIYFTSNCFSFFKPELEKEFPFFDVHQTHFFGLIQKKFNELFPLFEEVFLSYEKSSGSQHQVASAKLLALLYQLKGFVDLRQMKERLGNAQAILLKKFVQLVNDNYIEKRTVKEYAKIMSVTPKHLSSSIKATSGKNALSHINDRLTVEAKSLMLYTDMDITRICYQLNFSDPANFSKFFKKQVGVSPTKFRIQNFR